MTNYITLQYSFEPLYYQLLDPNYAGFGIEGSHCRLSDNIAFQTFVLSARKPVEVILQLKDLMF